MQYILLKAGGWRGGADAAKYLRCIVQTKACNIHPNSCHHQIASNLYFFVMINCNNLGDFHNGNFVTRSFL